jgi:hypothetical protein
MKIKSPVCVSRVLLIGGVVAEAGLSSECPTMQENSSRRIAVRVDWL